VKTPGCMSSSYALTVSKALLTSVGRES